MPFAEETQLDPSPDQPSVPPKLWVLAIVVIIIAYAIDALNYHVGGYIAPTGRFPEWYVRVYNHALFLGLLVGIVVVPACMLGQRLPLIARNSRRNLVIHSIIS